MSCFDSLAVNHLEIKCFGANIMPLALTNVNV